jgi:hypothetical protein
MARATSAIALLLLLSLLLSSFGPLPALRARSLRRTESFIQLPRKKRKPFALANIQHRPLEELPDLPDDVKDEM